MPCYHPIPATYGMRNRETGKRGVVFGRSAVVLSPRNRFFVPCGTCTGCKLEKSRQWAVRCMHEAKSHDDNCFITLTYDDDSVPYTPGRLMTLRPRDFELFMKRLRKCFGEGIRFFHCGEYGDKFSRPHHHALLFNHNFPDLKFYTSDNGNRLYESKSLENLWGHGRCIVGAATFESAAYIARYALKKVTGPTAHDYYQGRVPEYLTMSRRPGIARTFIEKYRTEIYKYDSLVVRGSECKPPRYYDDVQERNAPSVLARVKASRRVKAMESVDNTGKRLIVREAVKEAAVTSLKRSLEALGA